MNARTWIHARFAERIDALPDDCRYTIAITNKSVILPGETEDDIVFPVSIYTLDHGKVSVVHSPEATTSPTPDPENAPF